jgi:hypothetical protein
MNQATKTARLVDIGSVSVNKGLPQQDRCAEFKRQIKDIENYKCTVDGQTFSIKAVYANNGTYIEDCLRGMMA